MNIKIIMLKNKIDIQTLKILKESLNNDMINKSSKYNLTKLQFCFTLEYLFKILGYILPIIFSIGIVLSFILNKVKITSIDVTFVENFCYSISLFFIVSALLSFMYISFLKIYISLTKKLNNYTDFFECSEKDNALILKNSSLQLKINKKIVKKRYQLKKQNLILKINSNTISNVFLKNSIGLKLKNKKYKEPYFLLLKYYLILIIIPILCAGIIGIIFYIFILITSLFI
ncbi:MAG: hypothetical protein ACRC6T_02140 [Sarcina sp.]